MTKGGHTCIISDSHRVIPRAYMHRHKLHEKPEGWLSMGPIECNTMLDKMEPMIYGMSGEEKNLFSCYPHLTWDNYFSGDQIMNFAGEKEFGLTMTCQRDRLPKDVLGIYFHKEKTDVKMKSKVARFFHPVVEVKEVPSEP